jgi:ATP-binding cassette subfamily B multidrug efflux pump
MTRLLTRFLRPYGRRLLLIVTLVTIQALGNLYLPNLNADIINNGVVNGDTSHILSVGGWMLVITLFLGVCSIIAVYFASMTAMGIGRDVRSAIFRQVMGFSQKETNVFGTPSLITRNTNDVQQVQMVLVMAFNIMITCCTCCTSLVLRVIRDGVPKRLTSV